MPWYIFTWIKYQTISYWRKYTFIFIKKKKNLNPIQFPKSIHDKDKNPTLPSHIYTKIIIYIRGRSIFIHYSKISSISSMAHSPFSWSNISKTSSSNTIPSTCLFHLIFIFQFQYDTFHNFPSCLTKCDRECKNSKTTWFQSK